MGLMNVLTVANYFLSKSEPGTSRSVTPLKLQKLIYYADAFYVAWGYADRYNEKLFDDPIEAWVHGPVVRKVYDEYSNVSRNSILRKTNEPVIQNKDVAQLLDFVWQIYGGFTGSQLEHNTHMETPWQKARERAWRIKGTRYWESCNEPISDQDMKDFYGQYKITPQSAE